MGLKDKKGQQWNIGNVEKPMADDGEGEVIKKSPIEPHPS
jgi:hypothetical protein